MELYNYVDLRKGCWLSTFISREAEHASPIRDVLLPVGTDVPYVSELSDIPSVLLSLSFLLLRSDFLTTVGAVELDSDCFPGFDDSHVVSGYLQRGLLQWSDCQLHLDDVGVFSTRFS